MKFELGPEPTTAGQRRVVIIDHGDYRVYESIPPEEVDLPDPPTSERAKAHGLRRIKRRHFIDRNKENGASRLPTGC